MTDTTALLVSVLLLALNAFFVGAEFALIAARRSKVELMVAAGTAGARRTLAAMERVSLMMAGAQLGITVCSLGLGALAEPAIAHQLEPVFEALGLPHGLVHPVALVVALAIVVALHVVVGEMVPKNLALAAPERSAVALGPPLAALVRATRPLIALLNAMANLTLRMLGVQPRDEVASAFTADEVAGLVAESRREGLLEESQAQRLRGALALDELDLSSVLIPRNGLVCVRPGMTRGDVEDMVAATGFSRFPVEDLDGDLVGYVHVKDVLETDPDRRALTLDSAGIRALAILPAGTQLDDALAVMQRRGTHLAKVVDADGVTTGAVALEDVLEQLVGEVSDAMQRAESRRTAD